MTRKRALPIVALLLAVTLAGCYGRLDETPAPTTVPLPTSQPTVELTTPTLVRQAEATALSVPSPTRVVPPQEPIALPSGFGISVFVSGLNDPRMMALGPDGEVYVAERGASFACPIATATAWPTAVR